MLKMMDVDEVLSNTRKNIISRASEKLENRLQRYKPIFEDYLNGMLVSEIASKYNTTRYQIYSLLNRYNIPRRPISDLQLYYAKRLMEDNPKARKWLDESDCECFTCSWLRRS